VKTSDSREKKKRERERETVLRAFKISNAPRSKLARSQAMS